jgi:hypothetical protein
MSGVKQIILLAKENTRKSAFNIATALKSIKSSLK